MSIRLMRVVCVGLLVALFCLASAIGTSADPRTEAMVERVVVPLNVAMGILMKEMGGECSPGDNRRAGEAIQDAISVLREYQRQSY